MQIMLNLGRKTALGLLISLLCFLQTDAQEMNLASCYAAIFVTQQENTLSLFGLNASQELEHIWTLPQEIQPFRYPIVGEPTGSIPFNSYVRYPLEGEPIDDIQFIPHVNDIVPSHDGCHIAFVTARYPMRGFGERTFYIYSVRDNELRQFDLNVSVDLNLLNQLWSPNDQYLALNVEPGSIRIYSTVDETMTTFIRDGNSSIFAYFLWIDEEHLVFTKNGDIHLRSLNGETNRQLTFDRYQPLALFTWNPQSQRLFFVTGGLDRSNQVYSVDLEGNNRLELDLDEFYPGEFASRVIGINVNENTGDVYIFTAQLSPRVVVRDTGRVFRITPQSEVDVFTEISLEVDYAVLSPHFDTLAVLLSITATENQLLFTPLSSEMAPTTELNGNFCNYAYIANTRLVYVESGSFCWSGDLFLFDTITGEAVPLTSELDKPIWLLSPSRSTASWELPQMTWISDR